MALVIIKPSFFLTEKNMETFLNYLNMKLISQGNLFLLACFNCHSLSSSHIIASFSSQFADPFSSVVPIMFLLALLEVFSPLPQLFFFEAPLFIIFLCLLSFHMDSLKDVSRLQKDINLELKYMVSSLSC